MGKYLREIILYDDKDYTDITKRKRLYFHQWVNRTQSLIENEEGKLLKIKYTKFRFKTDSD